MSCPSSKYRRVVLLAACVAAILGANLAHAVQPALELQDIPQLEDLTRTRALALLAPLNDKQRLQIGPIQPGLQLARCDSEVKATQAPGFQVPGRTLIELSCEGHKPWRLFVPAKVIGTVPVVLAAHALITGTVLTAKDVSVAQHDMVGLPQGYLDDPAIAVGLTVSRAVSGGAILTNQQLLGTQMVQRGQSVTLIADAGGISVRMAGRALGDGLINQRVKVQNLSSGKVVEGIARSAQVVEIIF
jgi:flagella basal body P-ring formation protein FlgA